MYIMLTNIAFHAQDFDASLAFYRDVIGLQKIHGWDRADSRGVIFSLTKTSELELFGAARGAEPGISTSQNMLIRFQVENVDAEYTRLMQASVEIVDDLADRPWGDRSFTINDPDGITLCFFERRSELKP